MQRQSIRLVARLLHRSGIRLEEVAQVLRWTGSELLWRHADRSTERGEKIPGREPSLRPRERPARLGPAAWPTLDGATSPALLLFREFPLAAPALRTMAPQ